MDNHQKRRLTKKFTLIKSVDFTRPSTQEAFTLRHSNDFTREATQMNKTQINFIQNRSIVGHKELFQQGMELKNKKLKEMNLKLRKRMLDFTNQETMSNYSRIGKIKSSSTFTMTALDTEIGTIRSAIPWHKSKPKDRF